jgi:hypothetical protein
MAINLTLNNEQHKQDEGLASTASAFIHELDKQRLRILRCTAQAMASGPGGLRYKAGTRPWLDGLPVGPPAAASATSRRAIAVSLSAD